MSWTVVRFGKYEGKTLPQIIMLDPDWFFWMLPNFYGMLAKEAEDLARKARAIKIPKGKGKKLQVEYQYDIDGQFYGFEFVEASSWQHRWSLRLPHVDLAWPRSRMRLFCYRANKLKDLPVGGSIPRHGPHCLPDRRFGKNSAI